MGISLMGLNPDSIKAVPAYQRLAPIFRNYESLRHAKYFSEDVKAKLRVPREEFTLEKADDAWRLRPVQYAKHKVRGLDGSSNVWTTANRFEAQPARMRITALMAAAPYDSLDATVVEDFSKPEVFADRAAENGVSANIETTTEPVKTGSGSGLITANSDRDNPNGAWVRVAKKYAPPLNIAKQQALGVWVYGDGQGELLNVQLRSPLHTTSLGMGDHYVEIDFTGWRYFELIEMEGGRIADFNWPYGGGYSIYREGVDYGQIETLGLWLNQLPKGRKAQCALSPIKAMPLVKTTIKNPRVRIGGASILFPIEFESGAYLEFNSMSDCKLYGRDGAMLAEVKPEGGAPVLNAGDNTVEFSCDAPTGVNARAEVTVIAQGEPLK
jgi:hypothetical protein